MMICLLVLWSLAKKDMIVFLLTGIQAGSWRGKWDILMKYFIFWIMVILRTWFRIPFHHILSLHHFRWISLIDWLSLNWNWGKTFHISLRFLPYLIPQESYRCHTPKSFWRIGAPWRILTNFIAAIQAPHNVIHVNRGRYTFPVLGSWSGNYLFIGHKIIPLLWSHWCHSLKWFGKVSLVQNGLNIVFNGLSKTIWWRWYWTCCYEISF